MNHAANSIEVGRRRKRRRSRTPVQRVRWTLRRMPGGDYEGEIYLPMIGQNGACLPVRARGKTKADALNNAAGIAQQIASSPVLQAVLPPGASNAIGAVKMLSKFAKVGKLDKAMGKLVGKGAKRLAKALKFW